MSNAAIVVLVLGGLAYIAYVIPIMRLFFAYCDEVAWATGRTAENASCKTDEGGINAFQLEQHRLLRSGEFMNCGDPALVARGMVLAPKLRISFWAAVALVTSIVGVDLLAR